MNGPAISDLLEKQDEYADNSNVGTALKKNIDKRGLCYHVITQSWDKKAIFNKDVASYRHNLMCKLCSDRGIVILFSVTMPNHTHEVFLTPNWETLSAMITSLDGNVAKYIRRHDKDGRLKSKRMIFDYCPKYVIVKDIVYLLYLGKYIYDNPAHLKAEGRVIPDSCFWMFEKGHFVVPYDEKMYEKLFGLTYAQILELYATKTKSEVLEYARQLYADWTDEDNKRMFIRDGMAS